MTQINTTIRKNGLGAAMQGKINNFLEPRGALLAETRRDAFVQKFKQSVRAVARGAAAAPGLLDVIPGPAGRVSPPQHALRWVTGSVGALIGLPFLRPGAGFYHGQALGAFATRFAAQVGNGLIAVAKTACAAISLLVGLPFGLGAATYSAARFKSTDQVLQDLGDAIASAQEALADGKQRPPAAAPTAA